MLGSRELDREIDRLLLKEPTPENLNLIGDLFLRKGDKKRAVDYFMRAARNTSIPRKAIALYKKILRISPLEIDAYEALIDLLERSENKSEAIKYLDLLSRLYQNRGETLKFTETQRKIKYLKHEQKGIIFSRGTETPKELPVTFEMTEGPEKDMLEGETKIAGERHNKKRVILIGSAALLLLIVLLSTIFLFSLRKKTPVTYNVQKIAGNYVINVSSVSPRDLPDVIKGEYLKAASFNRITIKAMDGCIPEGIVDNPSEHIACLNNKGFADRPRPATGIDNSKRVIYKYGVCSERNDPIFVEFYIVCPLSHSSGLKIGGLVTEPLVLSWEKR